MLFLYGWDLQVQSESVWSSAYGTVTEQMSWGYFGCPLQEKAWGGTNTGSGLNGK